MDRERGGGARRAGRDRSGPHRASGGLGQGRLVRFDLALERFHSPEQIGLALGHRPRFLREFRGFGTKCREALIIECVVFHDLLSPRRPEFVQTSRRGRLAERGGRVGERDRLLLAARRDRLHVERVDDRIESLVAMRGGHGEDPLIHLSDLLVAQAPRVRRALVGEGQDGPALVERRRCHSRGRIYRAELPRRASHEARLSRSSRMRRKVV